MELHRAMRARVYWNFHRKCFSVQVRGRVVAHATHVVLFSPTFSVSKRGRERVLREKRKNVHAFISGEVGCSIELEGRVTTGFAVYNPYEHATFVDRESGRPVRSASAARCTVRDGRPEVAYAEPDVGGCVGVRYDR